MRVGKEKAPDEDSALRAKIESNKKKKKSNLKSRTSPGLAETAASGLLRGAVGRARRGAAAVALLVLQTPRAEGAWRRIVEERERKREAREKRLEEGKK